MLGVIKHRKNQAQLLIWPLLLSHHGSKKSGRVNTLQCRAQLLSAVPGLTFLVLKMFDLVSLWLITGMKKDLQGIYLYYVFAIACLREAVSAIFKMTNFKGKLAIC